MSKPVVGDSRILDYLSNTIDVSCGYVVGLIIGQTTETKDYVVHMAPTPCTDPDEKGEGPITVYDDFMNLGHSDVTTHAKNLTNMLPGGMWVLGFFAAGPESIFDNSKYFGKLKLILNQLNKSLAANENCYGMAPSGTKLVFYFNQTAKQYTCNSFDSSLNMKNVKFTFNDKITTWHKVISSYSLSDMRSHEFESKPTESIETFLHDSLHQIRENIDEACCTVNGIFRDDADTLINIKKITEQQRIKASKKLDDDDDSIKVYLYSMKAVKQDIVRSLSARFEMHINSTNVAEVTKDCQQIHQPPRRVLYRDPKTGITFSDYMFQDENEEDVAINMSEQLGVLVEGVDLEVNFEPPYTNQYTSSFKKVKTATKDNESLSAFDFKVIAVLVALAVLIVSVIIPFIKKL